jgi:hypothetical protein
MAVEQPPRAASPPPPRGGAAPKWTRGEQWAIDQVARDKGREWAESHATLILDQARSLLGDDLDAAMGFDAVTR